MLSGAGRGAYDCFFMGFFVVIYTFLQIGINNIFHVILKSHCIIVLYCIFRNMHENIFINLYPLYTCILLDYWARTSNYISCILSIHILFTVFVCIL